LTKSFKYATLKVSSRQKYPPGSLSGLTDPPLLAGFRVSPPPTEAAFSFLELPMDTRPTAFSRFPIDLLKQVEAAASQNDRSLSAELRCLVKEAIQARSAKASV
jgi:hypothetical protein